MRASAGADDEVAKKVPRRSFAAKVFGATALSMAANVGVGAGAARAFGSGFPGYDLDEAARTRAFDAIKRCALYHPRPAHTHIATIPSL